MADTRRKQSKGKEGTCKEDVAAKVPCMPPLELTEEGKSVDGKPKKGECRVGVGNKIEALMDAYGKLKELARGYCAEGVCDDVSELCRPKITKLKAGKFKISIVGKGKDAVCVVTVDLTANIECACK